MKSDVQATVAKAEPATRARLRYALALAEDGKRYLVVYDAGNAVKEARGYNLPPVLNRSDGSHYDPQQNELVAPIPPPKDRDYTTAVTK